LLGNYDRCWVEPIAEGNVKTAWDSFLIERIDQRPGSWRGQIARRSMLSDARDFPDSDAPPADIGAPAREKVHALLIDADARHCRALADIADRSRQLEFSITSCSSLDEAKALMAQRRFDVVYLEYWLGSETTIAFIHTMAALEAAPLIMLTDLDEPDIRRVAFRAGAQAFLSKDSLSPQALESVTLAVLRPRLNSRAA
jgi:CheY-like chemotaxis protein